MGKKRQPPRPTGGLEQSGLEKRLCNCICLCQLVSIISGVSLLYLSVIVVSPCKKTLDANFDSTEMVCTTLENFDSSDCKVVSCGEWCMSKGGSSCQIIYAKVRRPGTTVRFRNCEGVQATFCSAQEYNDTRQFVCSQGNGKNGECDGLDRFMDCKLVKNRADEIKTENTSLCRNITAIKDCTVRPSGVAQKEGIKICTRYTCNQLDGIYECSSGNCKKLENPKCVDRCSDLQLGRMAIVTPDLLHWGKCTSIEVNGTEAWRVGDNTAFAVYCTRLRNVSATEMVAEDCLNGTVLDVAQFAKVNNYKQVLRLLADNARPAMVGQTPMLSEDTVEIFNRSKVMINIDGCVNTLSKECTAWLADKGRDGSEGMHPAVYPCFVTPHATDYVITNYDRTSTVMLLVLAATVPSSVMVFSCFCLCLCGKTVGVNEFGLFFCKPCHKQDGDGGKEPEKLRTP